MFNTFVSATFGTTHDPRIAQLATLSVPTQEPGSGGGVHSGRIGK